MLAAFAAWLLLQTAGTTREAALMGGIFVLAAVLWVTEAPPLFATSLLVIGLGTLAIIVGGGAIMRFWGLLR